MHLITNVLLKICARSMCLGVLVCLNFSRIDMMWVVLLLAVVLTFKSVSSFHCCLFLDFVKLICIC